MRTHTRAGFTLVELMVAMALTLFVMVILSQAFVLSLETFSGMKGVGDMQQNLRVATVLLRDDLSQDHVEAKRRLSDPMIVAQPPQAGFLAVMQRSAVGSASYVDEGMDTNGMKSYRATDHVLYMTVKRRGNRQENFFTTALPGLPAVLNVFFAPANNTAYNVSPTDLADSTLTIPYAGVSPAYYSSQWAEVVYYLKRTGSTEEPHNPTSVIGTPTFGLYRSQFVMVPDGTNVSNKLPNGLQDTTFLGISCNANAVTGKLDFFSPADAAGYNAAPTPVVKRIMPQFNPAVAPTSRVLLNEALVLPNVISFQVQIMPAVATAPANLTFVDVPNNVYDSAQLTNAAYTNTFGLKAVQITLRVWDPGTRQTRQVTVVQDL